MVFAFWRLKKLPRDRGSVSPGFVSGETATDGGLFFLAAGLFGGRNLRFLVGGAARLGLFL